MEVRLYLQPRCNLDLVAQFEYGLITAERVLRRECADAAEWLANARRIDGKTNVVAVAAEGSLVDNAGGQLGADLAARSGREPPFRGPRIRRRSPARAESLPWRD